MRTRLQKVIAARLVVSTVLLGTAIAIDVVRPDTFPVNPFAFLIGLTFALSAVYLATLRLAERWAPLVDLQFAADAVLVSAFIHITGGITSHFSSLYMLPIMAASAVRGRTGAIQVASLGATLYTGLVTAQYLDVGVVPAGWWLPLAAALPTPGFAQYTVAINLSGMFAVAVLAGSLAERLRSARAGLQDASHEMADLRAFNEHVIDSLTSGLVTADAAGRILTFNRSAWRITGVSPQEARNADVRAVLQLPEGALPPPGSGSPASRRFEIPFTAPGGRPRDIGLTVAALTFPEGTGGYLITFQDVTELKRLERESRQQQRRAAVGEMAAGIAHEIRNPLASMAGSIEVLREELPLTDDQAELLDIVLRESERLNDRIRLFLAYARPGPRSVARLDLARVLDEVASLLYKSVDARPDHVVHTDVDGGAEWMGDEADVRQLLWSLGTNGLRAMPEGGRLLLMARVEASPDTAGGALPGRDLVIVVQDQGAGVPSQQLHDGFDPFRNASGRRTGIGLAVVDRIVADSGGRVQVSSIVGAGTTVTVTVPAPPHSATEDGAGADLARRSA